jgi:hypothetical protein
MQLFLHVYIVQMWRLRHTELLPERTTLSTSLTSLSYKDMTRGTLAFCSSPNLA